jgi:hypothetical protein
LFLETFAAAMAANIFTAMAVIGVIQFSRLDRQAKAEGRKISAPGYLYVLILLPAVMAVSAIYSVS